MQRYIAFLRGINVGGHRVKMSRLRELFEELGLDDVTTFIASGNVVFSAGPGPVATLENEIEAHLVDRLGYEVATFIRTPSELEAIAAHDGSGEGEDAAGSSLYVIFQRAPVSDDLKAVFDCLGSAMDEFKVSGREVFWSIRGKLTESPLFGGELGKALRGVPNTMRNMTTLRRLSAKLGRDG